MFADEPSGVGGAASEKGGEKGVEGYRSGRILLNKRFHAG